MNHRSNKPKAYSPPLRFAVLLTVIFFSLMTSHAIAEEDLVSLDDPAPVADDGGSLQEMPASAGADEAVSLDSDSKSEDFFNPYTFSRNPMWILLPVFGLIILGLHLMPVPKRKSKNKIDQAQRFFRGISGKGTSTNLIRPPAQKAPVMDRAPIPDDVTPNPTTQLLIKPIPDEDK